jgi:hypothetical protein
MALYHLFGIQQAVELGTRKGSRRALLFSRPLIDWSIRWFGRDVILRRFE